MIFFGCPPTGDQRTWQCQVQEAFIDLHLTFYEALPSRLYLLDCDRRWLQERLIQSQYCQNTIFQFCGFIVVHSLMLPGDTKIHPDSAFSASECLEISQQWWHSKGALAGAYRKKLFYIPIIGRADREVTQLISELCVDKGHAKRRGLGFYFLFILILLFFLSPH